MKVTEKAKLDKIQYAAAKVVTGVRHQASRTRLNQELAWEEITTRATFLGLTLFQKIADHETRSGLVSGIDESQKSKFESRKRNLKF